MTKRQQAVAFFIHQGWTTAQACGIVANLESESGLNPDAVGDGGTAFGLAQWRGSRQLNFAALMGKDIRGSSFEDQLAFVHAELQRWESHAGDALRDCQTAAESAAVICRLYERPADPDGDSRKRAALAEHIFAEYGGAEATPAAPDQPTTAPAGPDAPLPPKPSREARMPILALLAAFGPIIAQLIPQLATIMKPTEVSTRNLGLAQIAIDTITKAAGATNVQQAVEKLQASPELVKTVTEAVVTEPTIMQVITLAADAKEAVERSIVMQNAEHGFWWNPLFWITVMLMPMMYLITLAVLVATNSGVDPTGVSIAGAPWYTLVGFDQSTRSGLVNLIVGFIFGGVAGVWFGTTAQRSQPAQQK